MQVSSLREQETGSIAHFFLVVACSANTSTQWVALNSRMNRGSLRAGGSAHRCGHDIRALPEFTSDPEVLAASHQRITLAGFGGGWDSRRVKIFLFAPCNPYQPGDYPPKLQHVVNRLGGFSGYLPRHTSAYSLLTILGPTFVSLRGARPHPPGPNALLRMRRYLISGR